MVRNSREEWKTWQGVFDQFTERVLFKLASQGHFDRLKSIISPGKEAVVYTAEKKDGSLVAVKIYKLETAKFSKMYSYIRVDPRYHTLKNRQRQVIFAWTEREFRNLLLARNAGVCAPTPITQMMNVLVMEHIGTPSPLLKDAPPKDVAAFAEECMQNIVQLGEAGFVHGDLSEYNIINDNEHPVLIDYSHSVPLKAPNSKGLLKRDVETICTYFNRYGLEYNPKEIIATILKKQRTV